jgi:hypothetical protein
MKKWLKIAIVVVLLGGIAFAFPKLQQLLTFVRAAEAYVYGFPLVIMETTKEVLTASGKTGEIKAPLNQFARIRTYVSPDLKDVVRISVNSLWSHGFVDLEKEPFVVSQPDTKGRYIIVQGLNMWTDVFMSAGSRTTGTAANSYLVAGPNWNGTPPAGVKEVYRCSTRYSWILVQISCGSPAEYPEVHALQDGLKLTPLSAWGTDYSPPADVPVDPNADTTMTPFDHVRLMDGVTFFRRLAVAMKDNPAYPADGKAVATLKKLGIEPGRDFDPAKLSPSTRKMMNKAAQKVFTVLNTAQYDMKTVNGWMLGVNFGRYGTDYQTRAFIAFMGLGALPVEDAAYPSAFVDRDGNVLDGRSKYVMHFDKSQLPPPSHSGVWSISAYRENFYVRNSLERYGILSSMPLKYNADGSLDIYIQGKSPGADKESNWLPTPPSGPFNLTVRVYQAKKELYDGRTEKSIVVEAGSYAFPPVVKVP